MCRKRISVWCRQATKTNTVINEVLWQQIQVQFPELVASENEEGKNEKDVEDCKCLLVKNILGTFVFILIQFCPKFFQLSQCTNLQSLVSF